MSVIMQSDFFQVEYEAENDLMIVRRRSKSIDSLDSIPIVMGAMLTAIERFPAAGLLLDMRDGPSRNDPQFEGAAAPHILQLVTRFDRVAVLVRTAVGKLQIHRLSKDLRKGARSFLDEEEARRFLLTDSR
jgi:hypothetical protein